MKETVGVVSAIYISCYYFCCYFMYLC